MMFCELGVLSSSELSGLGSYDDLALLASQTVMGFGIVLNTEHVSYNGSHYEFAGIFVCELTTETEIQ